MEERHIFSIEELYSPLHIVIVSIRCGHMSICMGAASNRLSF